MDFIKPIIEIISGIVSSILLPLISIFLFYDSRKRKEEATASKEEAQARKEELAARKVETDNITSYAAEWKELYEKKEKKVIDLEAKIDQLYLEKNEDRKQIRELMEKNTALEIEKLKLEYQKCLRDDCGKRLPPRTNQILVNDKQ